MVEAGQIERLCGIRVSRVVQPQTELIPHRVVSSSGKQNGVERAVLRMNQTVFNTLALLNPKFVTGFIPVMSEIEDERRPSTDARKLCHHVGVLERRQRIIEPRIASGVQI